LQGDIKTAAINTGRLVVNTTVGLLGIIDVANKIGFPKYVKEDYGQTLGAWGVGPGCYLVLPVLGPSTIRDTAGSFANVLGGDPWYNASIHGNNEFLNEGVFLTSKALSGIEFRANNIESLDNLEKNSVDFYASVKSLYLQDRENKIENQNRGNIEVIYKNEEDWEEIDNHPSNVYSIEPDVFIQSTVNRASQILSKNISKEEKINQLKSIAKETVDIKGVGFYSLGSARKNLNDSQKIEYLKLFEDYFLKSFSSRLAEYTNPEIEVNDKKFLNENYTIVNSLLVGTSERPEVKIDWRVYTKDPENPLIRDLIIEGLSLARTQKEEFSSILNSNDGDINALFKTLEEFSKN
jgi:ABC-type transporter MlaC component